MEMAMNLLKPVLLHTFFHKSYSQGRADMDKMGKQNSQIAQQLGEEISKLALNVECLSGYGTI